MNNALAVKECSTRGAIELQSIIRPYNLNRALEMIEHIIVKAL